MLSRNAAGDAQSTLLQRRKIGRIEIHGFHLLDNLAVLLGFGGNFQKLRIFAELGPVLLGGGAAGMSQQIDQRVLGEFRIFGNPITDALDAMSFEGFNVVVAEIGLESFELALIDVVRPEFKYARLRGSAGGQQREQHQAFLQHEASVVSSPLDNQVKNARSYFLRRAPLDCPVKESHASRCCKAPSISSFCAPWRAWGH